MGKWGAAAAVRVWRMWNFCLHRVVVIYGNHTRVHSHTHADTEIIRVCFRTGSSSVIKAGHFFRQSKKTWCLSAPISKCMHAALAWARPRVELNVFRRDTSDEVLGQTRRGSAEFKNLLGPTTNFRLRFSFPTWCETFGRSTNAHTPPAFVSAPRFLFMRLNEANAVMIRFVGSLKLSKHPPLGLI